ncbi:autotransporter assembly complex protein TamA [Phenylobacterium deserti]|uniref:Bacterial surface antigen (D15) domain-containing protein n=1 Tax=Phenylobacterium deserti TaxID=1914756 RepID=A0A328AAY0_9CAUL|nr:BamA/TamA family outer membrane protein [Phenylobacterium deserti]RAK51366.1 hypothetical protein DJ018_15605 [Phenylobacterium deserti]
MTLTAAMPKLVSLAVLMLLCGATGAAAQQPPTDDLDDPAFDAALPPLEETAPPPSAPQVEPAEPALDPELDAPLPPLGTFETTPPATLADVVDAQAPAQVRYTVSATGLESVGLQDEFRDLSALIDGERRPAPAAQVRLRAEADLELMERLLRSQGYYDGRATLVFDPASGATDRLAVSLTATPGPRYLLGQIAVTGAEPEPTALALEALDLESGAPIVAAVIQTAEARVTLRLPQEGYPFAELGSRDIVLDESDHRGDYNLPLTAGPKATFRNIAVRGRPVFDARHVGVLARFNPGELYDSRKVDDLRQALVATGLLSTAAIEPVRTGVVGPGGTEAVDVAVRQSPAPPRSLAATAGYGTGEGFRLSGSWRHRNLFPPEGALALDAVAGTEEQRLGVTFRRSNAGLRDRTFQAIAEISRERREAYEAQSFNLGARVSRDSTPIWQKRWTWGYGAELIATNEERYDFTLGDRTRDTFFIAATPAHLGFDASDDLLNPTRGVRVTGRVSPELSIQDGNAPYVRSLVETTGYFPVGSSTVLAGRLRLGSIAGVERDRIAPSRRLYSGGGGSVRGFGYQDLGPRDPQNDPLGGRSQVEMALEARYRFGNFGIVPFVDAGQVYEDSVPNFSDLRVGVGVGARYYTNFGPIRFDVATPLDRRRGEPKVAIYVSIGQAF